MTPKILFVDDETNVLDSYRRGLRAFRKEWDLVYIDCPVDAWERIQNESFDVIVTDIRMPKISGLEVAVNFRAGIIDLRGYCGIRESV
jgi:DNA-binding NtrC family response regulator